MSFYHKRKFRKNYLGLDSQERAEVLALSCFTAEHWRKNVDWDLREEKIESRIRERCKVLFGDDWRSFRDKTDFTAFKTKYWYNGSMLNHFLAWHIQDQINGFEVRPERVIDDSCYDVLLRQEDSDSCGIEAKRLVRSNRMKSWLKDHVDRVSQRDADCAMHYFVNFYPIAENENRRRIFNFVKGYGYLSEEVHEFYRRDTTFVDNIVVPIGETDNTNPSSLEKFTKNLRNHLLG